MRRELLILRHGHAKSTSIKGDFCRDLKDKGKQNAQRIGVWLSQNHMCPDKVIASSALRAKRTAEKCIKSAGLNVSLIKRDDTLYEARSQTVFHIIKNCSNDIKRLMIVGHNPSLSNVVTKLSGQHVNMSPATLAHINLDCDWADLSPSHCDLKDLIVASDLPELFPYPDSKGHEQRIRPAYYYHQSCVVPYRIEKGDLQILIITSSKNKHWVVPKGIHDPSLTAQESAAKETFEEAGVIGHVSQDPLGNYRYQKWEATCDVSVYAMQVTKFLPDDEWEENHRNRKWVSLDQAEQLINNPDLAVITSKLAHYLSGKKA